MRIALEAIEADITRLALDAIVNAANESLSGGAGAAGPGLVDECRALPMIRPFVRCPTGEAVITRGYALPARHVIHTVGPVWYGGDKGEPALLQRLHRTLGDAYSKQLRWREAMEEYSWVLAKP